jgi:hypothetical protein
MANYVFSFRSPSGRTPTAEEEAEWGAWFQEIGSSIVDRGNRVGRVSALGASSTNKSDLGGYMVISATDLDAATVVAKGCPGLRHGGAVEVGEILDM